MGHMSKIVSFHKFPSMFLDIVKIFFCRLSLGLHQRRLGPVGPSFQVSSVQMTLYSGSHTYIFCATFSMIEPLHIISWIFFDVVAGMYTWLSIICTNSPQSSGSTVTLTGVFFCEFQKLHEASFCLRLKYHSVCSVHEILKAQEASWGWFLCGSSWSMFVAQRMIVFRFFQCFWGCRGLRSFWTFRLWQLDDSCGGAHWPGFLLFSIW